MCIRNISIFCDILCFCEVDICIVASSCNFGIHQFKSMEVSLQNEGLNPFHITEDWSFIDKAY